MKYGTCPVLHVHIFQCRHISSMHRSYCSRLFLSNVFYFSGEGACRTDCFRHLHSKTHDTSASTALVVLSDNVLYKSIHLLYFTTGRIHAYDTIRDVILTCARKPTWVSLIYRTESTTKKCKTEKLKVRTDMLRSNSKSLGNHDSQSWRRKRCRLQWEELAEKAGFKSGMKERVGDGKLIILSMNASSINDRIRFNTSNTIRTQTGAAER